MNILPKKSWHVLSRDNIQRVRRDEAAAKAKEEEQQGRADLAEKEARLAYMRRQAREKDGIMEESSAGAVTTDPEEGPHRHINLFTDIQHGVGVQSLKNKEYEMEEKKEREKFEKRVGILNYLVDKDKSDDPWYVKDRKKEEKSARARKRAELQDPLIKMNEFLEKKRKVEESAQEASYKEMPRKTPLSESRDSSSDERHTHEKNKYKDKKKSSSTDMEKLRRERKRREEAERSRAEDLLRRYHGLPNEIDSTDSTSRPVPDRKYNSQFNPHLARH